MNGEAGKGDRYRPVDGEKYRRNYARIFETKEEKKEGSGVDQWDDEDVIPMWLLAAIILMMVFDWI